jgi:hypothetical protein
MFNLQGHTYMDTVTATNVYRRGCNESEIQGSITVSIVEREGLPNL